MGESERAASVQVATQDQSLGSIMLSTTLKQTPVACWHHVLSRLRVQQSTFSEEVVHLVPSLVSYHACFDSCFDRVFIYPIYLSMFITGSARLRFFLFVLFVFTFALLMLVVTELALIAIQAPPESHHGYQLPVCPLQSAEQVPPSIQKKYCKASYCKIDHRHSSKSVGRSQHNKSSQSVHTRRPVACFGDKSSISYNCHSHETLSPMTSESTCIKQIESCFVVGKELQLLRV